MRRYGIKSITCNKHIANGVRGRKPRYVSNGDVQAARCPNMTLFVIFVYINKVYIPIQSLFFPSFDSLLANLIFRMIPGITR